LWGNSAIQSLIGSLAPAEMSTLATEAPAVEMPAPAGGFEIGGAEKGLLLGGLVGGPLGAALGYGIGTLVDIHSESTGADTGLGKEVDTLVDASPVLSGKLEQAEKDGWTVQYGVAGEGTYADPNTKTIFIDPTDKGDAAVLANSLAHELGHANYETEAFIPMAGLTRDEFIKQNTYRDLRGEAEATIAELEVRGDLMASDEKLDSGISGATGDQKKALWVEYQAGNISRTELVDQIAGLFATGETTSTTNENYYDYYSQTYAEHWDNANP
jgi:type VI secretion system secreted protein VgrG